MVIILIQRLWLYTFICSLQIISHAHSEISGSKYKALVGGDVQLACNITSFAANDAISTIFWYKENTQGAPIYTVDSRNSTELSESRHFAGESLRNRATFNASVQLAFLSISPIKELDSGEYRCRVDFRWSRTMNTVVYLQVIVPPTRVKIVDGEDRQLPESLVSYGEGNSLTIKCIAYGGKPPPIVEWYSDNKLMDDSYTTQITEHGLVSVNEMTINKLTRSNLKEMVACKASNTNLTIPLVKSFVLDINLRPNFVKITSIKRPLSAYKTTEIVCQTKGSRPPARITWFIGPKPIISHREFSQEDANGTFSTTSVLNFVPSSRYNGAWLTCRSENLRLVNSSIKDEWLLNIYYQPKVELFIRSPNSPDDITEKDEVIFECVIDSNPIAIKVGWLFNKDILQPDLMHGLVIENTTMVIKRIEKAHSGKYSCFAENIEGRNISNKVEITVNYAPVCRANQRRVYVATTGKSVRVFCAVDAEPRDVKISWRINSTVLNQNLVASSRNTDGLHVSSLLYTPQHEKDYGALECSARNKIGTQTEPCIFFILPAAPPEPIHTCTVSNQTWESVMIFCEPGTDGGLNQTFILQVFDHQKENLLQNLTRKERPNFIVSGLSSSATYILELYASNAKGSSNLTTLIAQTLSMQEQKSAEHLTDIKFNPYLAMAMALGCTLVLVAIIIVLIIFIRNRDDRSDCRRKNCPSLGEFDKRDNQELDVVSSTRSCKAFNISSSQECIQQTVDQVEHPMVNVDEPLSGNKKTAHRPTDQETTFRIIQGKPAVDCLSLHEELSLTHITAIDDFDKEHFNTLPRLKLDGNCPSPRIVSHGSCIDESDYTFSTPV